MLALVITASFMFIVNYLWNLLSNGIPLKLTEVFVILTKKSLTGIFLDKIGRITVMTQTFCGLTGKLNLLVL